MIISRVPLRRPPRLRPATVHPPPCVSTRTEAAPVSTSANQSRSVLRISRPTGESPQGSIGGRQDCRSRSQWPPRRDPRTGARDRHPHGRRRQRRSIDPDRLSFTTTIRDYERPTHPGGWGWFLLNGATVAVGVGWGDADAVMEDRGLKQRARIATWRVPVPPRCAR
jgi:hypothetical protein